MNNCVLKLVSTGFADAVVNELRAPFLRESNPSQRSADAPGDALQSARGAVATHTMRRINSLIFFAIITRRAKVAGACEDHARTCRSEIQGVRTTRETRVLAGMRKVMTRSSTREPPARRRTQCCDSIAAKKIVRRARRDAKIFAATRARDEKSRNTSSSVIRFTEKSALVRCRVCSSADRSRLADSPCRQSASSPVRQTIRASSASPSPA